MKAVIPVLTFALRHFVFVVIAAFAGCGVWTIAYLVLLVIAVFTDPGVGGPLAFPAGIIAVVTSCGFIGWGIFTPASAVGAIFCALARLPRIAAIPVVWVVAFGLSYLFYWAALGLLVVSETMPSLWTMLKNFGLFLSVPLGIYWWLTEGTGAIFDKFRRWIFRRLTNRSIRDKRLS